MHTSGPGIWPETLKNKKMKNAHCRILIVARKLKNVENETQTLYDLEYCKKHLKTWKREMLTVGPGLQQEIRKTWKKRIGHFRSWDMARKLKNVENGRQTLYDLEHGEKD